MDGPLSTELLVAHGEWLRRLAAYLLHDAPDAEDVVQQTWEAALRSPPQAGRPPRPWLAQVLRNVIRSTARTATRRVAREVSAALAPESPASAEELLARMRLQEQIAGLMTALEEPYRTTLLRRFYEGRDASEIAEASGVPSGTVRWRISEGIRRLRERLDAQPEGHQRWRAILLPLAPSRPRGEALPRAPVSPLLAGLGGMAGVLAVVAGVFLAVGGRTTVGPNPPSAPPAGASAGESLASARGSERGLATINETKEETMRRENLKRAAAFLGVALPALVASADAKRDPLVEEGINLCVAMRERFFECKDEFADAIVARRDPPPERRASLRRKVLEEITADGAGPLEPRREKCAAMAKPGSPPSTERAGLDRLKKVLDECTAKPDCTARVACLIQVFPPGGGRPKP